MCLIAFALNEHPQYPLILIANRDEFFARPTDYAAFWENHPDVLAGKDLKGGGTWMGVNKQGKIAAVTNYRDPQNINETAKTRGDLTKDFLIGDLSAEAHMMNVAKESSLYNGFNLLLFENGGGFHFSNYGKNIRHMSNGIFGLSNAVLDTPWPKLEKLKRNLSEAIAGDFDSSAMFDLLQDNEKAADEDLPKTGVPYEWEKALSSICIKTENYGTCCSTIITIDHQGVLSFMEKSYPVGARESKTLSFQFEIES